ncbi:MAG: polysaccharide deacetylase family protein, partial [Bifidobacteriaceae bacterium]|nr:polysaccharide deacetylase family protein [Bifidobacteriaceae bacterium]
MAKQRASSWLVPAVVGVATVAVGVSGSFTLGRSAAHPSTTSSQAFPLADDAVRPLDSAARLMEVLNPDSAKDQPAAGGGEGGVGAEGADGSEATAGGDAGADASGGDAAQGGGDAGGGDPAGGGQPGQADGAGGGEAGGDAAGGDGTAAAGGGGGEPNQAGAGDAGGGEAAGGAGDPASSGSGEAPVDCAVAKCVALTFDDGPDKRTDAILDVLAARGVHATFFVQGYRIDLFPDQL